MGLPSSSSSIRAMPKSSSSSSSTGNVKEGTDRSGSAAGILQLDPSIIAELRDEWGEDEDEGDVKPASGQVESSSSSAIVTSGSNGVDDFAMNDISVVATHDATDDVVATSCSATELPAVLDCGGGGVDSLQAAIDEVKTAPPAPPATYRRLQLAPRTLPLSMPPMVVKTAPATTTVTDCSAGTKPASSSSKSRNTAKNPKTKTTTKPASNGFLMLGDDDADDDDDEEVKEETNYEKKQEPLIEDEDNDLITALLASEIEEINNATMTPLDAPTSSSSWWSCTTCTLINEEAENECKACGTPSHSSDDATWQTAK